MSYKSIIKNKYNNKSETEKNILFNNLIYRKNHLDEDELCRLNFLQDLINTENLNIPKFNIIESNISFLHKNLLPKIIMLKNKIHQNTKNSYYYESINSAYNSENMQNNFDILKENIEINMKIKFLDYFLLIPKLKKKFHNLYFQQDDKFLKDFTYIFFPLANYIYESQINKIQNTPIIIGIQAHQGCGKTTTCSIISYILGNFYDINCAGLSSDDFYNTFSELNKLTEKNPKFKYRGPPGTHDLILAEKILQKIKNNEINYYIPRYNKLLNKGKGDRDDKGVEIKFPIEVLLFEGWFNGALPVKEENLLEMNSKLEKYNKSYNIQLLKEVNLNLYDYINLWNNVDFFLSLRPENFTLSKKWRKEAEKKSKGGMDYKMMNDFIQYFWNSLPPDIYLDNLDLLNKTYVRIIIDENRNFYI